MSLVPESRWPAAVPLILSIAAVSFLCALEILSPGFFFWDDNSTFHLPWYLFNYRAVIDESFIPLVNFHQFAGQPYLAQGQRGVFYPPTYAAVWLSEFFSGGPLWTMDILIGFHFLCGALAMFALLRAMGVRPSIGFLGSLAYLTVPFYLVASKSWVHVAYTFLYLPLIQVLVELLLRKRSALMIGLLALTKTLFFYQGYYEYVFYQLLFEAFFLFGRRFVWRNPFRPQFLVDYCFANLIALLAVLPSLLLFLETLSLSAERALALPSKELLYGSVTLGGFLAAQTFDFGARSFGQSDTRLFYLGALVPFFFLIVIAYFRGSRISKTVAFFCVLALGAFLISTNFRALLAVVPPFDRLRWPFKTFAFAAYFLTLAISLLTEDLIEKGVIRQWIAACTLATVVLLNGLGMFPPGHTRPFGNYRLTSLQEDVRAHITTEGRLLGYRINPQTERDAAIATFNYPTMFGLFGIAGYDPLRSVVSSEIGLGLESSSVFVGSLSAEFVEHLNKWSVKYLVVPNVDAVLATVHTWPQLHRIFATEQTSVFLNREARPLAYFEDEKTLPLEVHFAGNRVTISTQGRVGEIRLALAPLPAYQLISQLGNSLSVKDGQLLVSKTSVDDQVILEYQPSLYRDSYWTPFVAFGLILSLVACGMFRRIPKRAAMFL